MKKFLIGFIVFSLVLLMFPAVVSARPRFSFTKEVDCTEVFMGDEVTYTFTVIAGVSELRDMVVKDSNPDIDVIEMGDIDAVTSKSATRTVTLNEVGELTNTATVSGQARRLPPNEDEWITFSRTRTATVNVVALPEPEPEPKRVSEPEPCNCALIVQVRDETGNAINRAVLKVDGIEKTTVNGDARWDNLKCDTSYKVRELSPIKQTKGIHLGSCGDRSTMRIVNKVGEEIVEPKIEIIRLPETGQNLLLGPFLTLSGLILAILSRKRK